MKRALVATMVLAVLLLLVARASAAVTSVERCSTNADWTATSNDMLSGLLTAMGNGQQMYFKDAYYMPDGSQVSLYGSKNWDGELGCSFGSDADAMAETEYDAIEAEYKVAPSYTGSDGNGGTIEGDAQIADQGYEAQVVSGDTAAAEEMGAAGTDAGIIGTSLEGTGALATGVADAAGAGLVGWNIGTQIDKWLGLPFMDTPWSSPSTAGGSVGGTIGVPESPPTEAFAVAAGTCVGPGVVWDQPAPVSGEGCSGSDVSITSHLPPESNSAPYIIPGYESEPWETTLPVATLDVGHAAYIDGVSDFIQEFGAQTFTYAFNDTTLGLPSESWTSFLDGWLGEVYAPGLGGVYPIPDQITAGIEPLIGSSAGQTKPSGTVATATETPTEPSSPDPAKLFTDPQTQHLLWVVGGQVPGANLPPSDKSPGLLTIPTPTPDELYTDYSNQLTTDGFTNFSENVLSDSNTNTSVGPNAVSTVSPAPGSQVEPDTAIAIDVNPSDAPSPSSSGGGFLPGPPAAGVTLPAIPTPCGTIGGSNSVIGTNSGGGFNFPFGVPCWIVATLGQFKTTPTAPHVSWPVAPFGSIDVNLGTAFGGALDSLMTYIRLLILFGAVVFIVRWFARVYGFGAVGSDGDNTDNGGGDDE